MIGPDMLHIRGHRLPTEDLVERTRKRGLSMFMETIDDPDELRRLVAKNADGIITGDPAILDEVKETYLSECLCSERK